MSQTLAEKLVSRAAGKAVRPGEIAPLHGVEVVANHLFGRHPCSRNSRKAFSGGLT